MVRVLDGPAGRERTLPVGQERCERRLVGNERPDLLRVASDKGERVHRAAAAREQVDGSEAQLGDDPMDVVGVLFGR